ncbi:MAG TPA: glycosyltransferase family 4 protein [Candidatus Nanoarchaeia archaeon]|nr:glycosyltransferase family 4 protein [Candidatus Nanoarchaeia archaeon]
MNQITKENEENEGKIPVDLLFISLSSLETLHNSIHKPILQLLSEKFRSITVFCWGKPFQKKEGNITYYSGNILDWWKFRRRIGEAKIIYINDFFVGGLFGTFIKGKSRLVFRCGSPWKYDLHSLSALLKSFVVTFSKPVVIRSCDKVVYNSQAIVQKQYSHPWEVVYNGVDTQFFSPQKFSLQKKEVGRPLQLLFVGRIWKEKGLDYLFEAVHSFSDSLFDGLVSLTVVGDGPLVSYYKNKYFTKNNYIHFIGRIPQEELPKIIHQHDIIVLPSLRNSAESFPNALLEAMACGKPVIASSVWGIPEMVDDGKTGFLVPEKDVAAIVYAIKRFLENPEWVGSMGKAGRERVEKNFELKSQLQKLYKHLFCEI